MSIYYLCPDTNTPYGGIKQLYRHVDILNKNNYAAFILHQNKGFRCTWFKNQTPIVYLENLMLFTSDYLVLPENYGPRMADHFKGMQKVIFNQGCYNTFHGYNLEPLDFTNPYNHNEVVATMVVSEDSLNYLNYVFPNLKIFRIHNGIDQSLFNYQIKKEKLISLIVNKSIPDIVQVINIIKFRGLLRDYQVAFIKDRTQEEVAAIMKKSLLFLSFGYHEGFSLPPAEAMACGCIVIGYHGNGGREFFNTDFSYPIPQGDIIKFVQTIEEVMNLHDINPKITKEKGRKAADYIQNHYSTKKEEEDVVSIWNLITGT